MFNLLESRGQVREQRHRRGNTLIATTWFGPRWRSSHTLLKPDSDSPQADGDSVPSLAWSDSSALWLKAGTTFTRASRTGDVPAVRAWIILLPLLRQSSHQSSHHTAADGSCWESPSLSGPVLHRSASWPNRCGGTFCCTSAGAHPRSLGTPPRLEGWATFWNSLKQQSIHIWILCYAELERVQDFRCFDSWKYLQAPHLWSLNQQRECWNKAGQLKKEQFCFTPGYLCICEDAQREEIRAGVFY